jgi:hypothetical protein
VHRKITINQALGYAARLRLPRDTTDMEIGAHIKRVLEQVRLSDKAALRIDTPAPLSGGQLKRVSLAVELVADPNVLFLDEVTSGLDAGTDKHMMKLFAELAADQKTIVCVTHTLENIDECHLIVLLHQGRLVYFGPPQEAAQYFGINRLIDVYELLESASAEHWAERFLASPFYQQYITDRFLATSSAKTNPSAVSASPNSHQRLFDWMQTMTLLRRNMALAVADWKNLAILLLQAPLIAVIIGLVLDTDKTNSVARAATESQVGFILVISAIWCGCLNSAREIVKELPIYLRERSVNLGIGPYLASKMAPLAGLCALQCLMLLGIVSVFVSIPGDTMTRFWGLFSAGMGATAMGLTVSAFVDSNDKAIALVPILLIPQVILSNAVVDLEGWAESFAQITMISFNAFDAVKASLSDASLNLLPPLIDIYWDNQLRLVTFGVAFLFLAFVGLRLKDRRV